MQKIIKIITIPLVIGAMLIGVLGLLLISLITFMIDFIIVVSTYASKDEE